MSDLSLTALRISLPMLQLSKICLNQAYGLFDSSVPMLKLNLCLNQTYSRLDSSILYLI